MGYMGGCLGRASTMMLQVVPAPRLAMTVPAVVALSLAYACLVRHGTDQWSFASYMDDSRSYFRSPPPRGL